MKLKGVLKAVNRDIFSGRVNLHFEVESFYLGLLDDIKGKVLSIDVDIFAANKTNAQNSLFWRCVGELSAKREKDKNLDIYREMLRKYGVFSYAVVKPTEVDLQKREYRDIEELGPVIINGEEWLEIICYLGVSKYNRKEYSRLIDGIIQEMIAEHLNPPTSEEMQRALKACEKEGKK